jgi:hypothetical protein
MNLDLDVDMDLQHLSDATDEELSLSDANDDEYEDIPEVDDETSINLEEQKRPDLEAVEEIDLLLEMGALPLKDILQRYGIMEIELPFVEVHKKQSSKKRKAPSSSSTSSSSSSSSPTATPTMATTTASLRTAQVHAHYLHGFGPQQRRERGPAQGAPWEVLVRRHLSRPVDCAAAGPRLIVAKVRRHERGVAPVEVIARGASRVP